MTTLPSMGLVLPTRGAPGAGTWDDTIDANLGLLDAHNHAPGSGEQVPTAGININADLTFGGLYAPINLHRLTFASIVALSTNNKSLFVSSSDNELYWRSNAGANVKITNGAALNVAAFTGGFGAGYSSSGAVADYDSSTTRYTFKTNTGTWARGAFGGIRLYEHGTSAATYVALLSPASLASTYSLTMPAALPASTAVVQMSSTGQVSPIATNDSITISGTGVYKHGDRKLTITAASYQTMASPAQIGAGGVPSLFFGSMSFASALNFDVLAHVPLPVGARVRSVKTYFNRSSGNVVASFYKNVPVSGFAQLATATDSSTSGNGSINLTSIDYTIEDDSGIAVYFNAGATGNVLFHAVVTYDQP